MALSYFDLETQPVSAPARRPQPITAARPTRASSPVVQAVQPEEHVVDVTDHSASYWVRRRRAEAQLRASQPS
ncbi:MAG: hypothetical protein QOE76_1698 [Frankiales bacterium]|jgi:hypothetical protein|nr:hypothetical protein [Frankiales bacterium]